MEKFKGTTEKWEIIVQNSVGSLITAPEGIKSICIVYGDSHESLANAKLIASAPEMLEMIDELLKELSFHGFNNSTAISNAKQLISKITDNE